MQMERKREISCCRMEEEEESLIGFIGERCSMHPATLGRGALGFDSIPGPS